MKTELIIVFLLSISLANALYIGESFTITPSSLGMVSFDNYSTSYPLENISFNNESFQANIPVTAEQGTFTITFSGWSEENTPITTSVSSDGGFDYYISPSKKKATITNVTTPTPEVTTPTPVNNTPVTTPMTVYTFPWLWVSLGALVLVFIIFIIIYFLKRDTELKTGDEIGSEFKST